MKQVLLAIGGGVVLVLLSGCDGGSGSGSATNDAAGNPLTAPVDHQVFRAIFQMLILPRWES